jgi:hypothetical protein
MATPGVTSMKVVILTLMTLAAHGCAPSESEIKLEFADFLSEHQACEHDSDCTLITPGCPLGCSAPIAAAAAAAGERLARDLIADYESGGRSCDYECVFVCGAACKSGRCDVVQPSSSTDTVCP